jgi:hypothetical protein
MVFNFPENKQHKILECAALQLSVKKKLKIVKYGILKS